MFPAHHHIYHSLQSVNVPSMTASSCVMQILGPALELSQLNLAIIATTLARRISQNRVELLTTKSLQTQFSRCRTATLPCLTPVHGRTSSILEFSTLQLMYRPFLSSTGSVMSVLCGTSLTRTPTSTANLLLRHGHPPSPYSTPCKVCQLLVSLIHFPQ